jgi:hypothetical protein
MKNSSNRHADVSMPVATIKNSSNRHTDVSNARCYYLGDLLMSTTPMTAIIVAMRQIVPVAIVVYPASLL